MFKFILSIFASVILFTACDTSPNKNEITSARNKQLTDFQSKSVMDMDGLMEAEDKRYQELHAPGFNPATDSILFRNGHIYISYLAVVNGCAEYAGDIDIKNDSIYLKLISIGEYECTEKRVDRVTFRISNPENRKYEIVKW